MSMDNLAAVVLAAGKGTRMESDTPKVLHTLAGKPIIFYILKTLDALGLKKIYVVVSHQAGLIREIISENFKVAFVDQEQPVGTADALKSALVFFDTDITDVLVMNGDDSAFYKEKTVKDLLGSHKDTKAVISVLTLKGANVEKMARIAREGDGSFKEVVEFNPSDPKVQQTGEINCGMYIFNLNWLKNNINKVRLSEKGEYYITDLLNIAKTQGEAVNPVPLKKRGEWFSINSRKDLERANRLKK